MNDENNDNSEYGEPPRGDVFTLHRLSPHLLIFDIPIHHLLRIEVESSCNEK